MGNGKEIDDAINSIDEDNNDKDINDNDTNDNDNDIDYTDEATPKSNISSLDKEKVYKLRSNSPYLYDGPLYHHSTSFPTELMAANEFVIKELPFNCAPGILFEIMFNSEQNEYLMDFLRGQEGSQITKIPDFTSVNGSSTPLKREYSYEKGVTLSCGTQIHDMLRYRSNREDRPGHVLRSHQQHTHTERAQWWQFLDQDKVFDSLER